MIHKLLLSILIITSLCSGCDSIKIKQDTQQVVAITSYSEDAKTIADSMKNISKDDAELMYMQFSGLAQYMSHTKKIKTTAELNKIFGSFQQDYGYSREKYKAYSDAVEAFFLKNGYQETKNIVDNVADSTKEISRSQVIEDMKILGDAAKLALENINAKVQ